jgi:hypothetical protein
MPRLTEDNNGWRIPTKKCLTLGAEPGRIHIVFGLDDIDLDTRILDCASGPASFNAEMTAANYKITSIDPLYQFSAEEIANRVDKT